MFKILFLIIYVLCFLFVISILKNIFFLEIDTIDEEDTTKKTIEDLSNNISSKLDDTSDNLSDISGNTSDIDDFIKT